MPRPTRPPATLPQFLCVKELGTGWGFWVLWCHRGRISTAARRHRGRENSSKIVYLSSCSSISDARPAPFQWVDDWNSLSPFTSPLIFPLTPANSFIILIKSPNSRVSHRRRQHPSYPTPSAVLNLPTTTKPCPPRRLNNNNPSRRDSPSTAGPAAHSHRAPTTITKTRTPMPG